MTAPFLPFQLPGNVLAQVLAQQQRPHGSMQAMSPQAMLPRMNRQLQGVGEAGIAEIVALLRGLTGNPLDPQNPVYGVIGAGSMGMVKGAKATKAIAKPKPKPRPRAFHGTDEEFSQFHDGPTWFAASADDIFVKSKKTVKQAELDLANPLTPSTAKAKLADIQAAFAKARVPEHEAAEVLGYIGRDDPSAWFYVSPQMQRAYESLGFDGIHVNEGIKSGDWYVTFRGKQATELR
jgi:hypothetical protein